MQRPTGVTILAVVSAIGGIFGILAALALLGFGAFLAAASGLGGLAFIFGLILLVIAIAELVLAYGFWMLREWAWVWGITLQAISVLRSLIYLVLGYESISNLIVQIVVAGIIIYYLNQPAIRKAFGAPEKGWPFIGSM